MGDMFAEAMADDCDAEVLCCKGVEEAEAEVCVTHVGYAKPDGVKCVTSQITCSHHSKYLSARRRVSCGSSAHLVGQKPHMI
jgi:hypothetical protein